MEVEEKNAIIESTMLGIESHGMMSFYLYLDYGDSSMQGAGGYCLDMPVKDSEGDFLKRVGTAVGTDLIMEILRVVGVDKWEDLKGEHIRVKSNHCKVEEIGNFLKDEWLNFEEFFNKHLLKEKR